MKFEDIMMESTLNQKSRSKKKCLIFKSLIATFEEKEKKREEREEKKKKEKEKEKKKKIDLKFKMQW
ncbi:hypothetical protein BpHYR1_050618 [Brachionus plicatilis]|uniref:Uncharacterized protein n=1 Tax=Brachionus plicatilis TaxID=10195 RepID=A0A3M7PGG4_BRAPC|nr:hypothetical protein BpHYR1_050618 [Brachionus plicatilis]